MCPLREVSALLPTASVSGSDQLVLQLQRADSLPPNITLTIEGSDDLGDEDPWDGRRGRIDAKWVKEQVGELPDTVFYACGPNPLVEFAETLVRDELGVGKEQMIIEKWG